MSELAYSLTGEAFEVPAAGACASCPVYYFTMLHVVMQRLP